MNTFVMAAPTVEINQFCQRWLIRELALFGSALREDFGPDSDVDVLATFAPEAKWSLLDHVKMEQELQAILHRKVDLMSKRALERSRNRLLRDEILNTAQTLIPPQQAVHAAR